MSKQASPRTRRSRGSIDADLILRGAFDVARSDGLDGMSMPNLAAHLGVGVTSIYWYFRSKDELLQQMFQHANHEFEASLVTADRYSPEQWREYLVELFDQVRAAYTDDDLFAELVLHRLAGHSGNRTPGAFERVEADLEYLERAGFSLVDAWQLYSTLRMFTQGVATTERARRRSGYPAEGAAQLTELDQSTTPRLTRLVLERGTSLDMSGGFRPGLELILDAVEAKRKRQV